MATLAREQGLVPDELVHAILRALGPAYGQAVLAFKKGVAAERIGARMKQRRLAHARDYLRLLESSARERDALMDTLLIGTTAFFRDAEAFAALRTNVLPNLLTRVQESPLRIWVAGCSTGEEAYSLLMCLSEALEASGRSLPVQLFATDVNEQALAVARRGIYPRAALEHVSPERRERFFSRTHDGRYCIGHSLRQSVLFRRHDLFHSPPYGRLHLVSCRNVLIYFDEGAQQQGFARFHDALVPNGCLFLGNSESVGRSEELFALEVVTTRTLGQDGLHSGYRCALHDITERKALETERRRLHMAESRERVRLALLEAAAQELAAAPDLPGTRDALSFVAALPVPALADFCCVYLVDGHELRGFRGAHYDPKAEQELDERVRSVCVSEDDREHLLNRVLAENRPLRLKRSEIPGIGPLERDRADPEGALAVPLWGRHKKLGVMCFGCPPQSELREQLGMRWACELAARCAYSLENVMLLEELQRAVRSRDALLATVSHDLRNPLNAISLSARHIAPKPPTQERRSGSRHVDLIRRSVLRMEELLEDLLVAGNIEAGHLTLSVARQLLKPVVDDVCQLLEPVATQRQVTLCAEVPADCTLEFDRRRVQQVLTNLVSNAIKFTPAEGVVTVRAAPRTDVVLVSVTDTGPGIAEGQRSRVFERYFTGSAHKGGLGLGLYIAQRLVEAHGGRLWLEDAQRPGCTFSFELPIARGPASSGQADIN